MKMAMTTSGQSLLKVLLLPVVGVVAQDNEENWKQWTGVVRYIAAWFFVVLGLHAMLYSHLATHALLKRYQYKAKAIWGTILECEARADNAFQVSVLYHATSHKYANNPRLRFRQPDAVEEKRYMRRWHTQQPLQRGTRVELLLLPNNPKSALAQEVILAQLSNHSYCRTCLVLSPGLLLLSAILYLAIRTVQEQDGTTVGFLVVVVSFSLILIIAQAWSRRRFDAECRKKFFSAVAMRTTETRSDPLLQSHDGIPIVQGQDVIT